MTKYYKNETYRNLYKIGNWHVVANSIEHLKGLYLNRGNVNFDTSKVIVVANNITVIEKECDTYEEATGISNGK